MELTNALGLLLSDRSLRETFRRDPQEAARRLDLDPQDGEALRSLDPAGLDAQAQTLLNKRCWEVSRLIPRTFKTLGKDARRRFLDFAESYWPVGHKKHVDDALGFCRRLMEEDSTAACRAETNWIRFLLDGGRFAVRYTPDLHIRDRRYRALQFFWRGRDRFPRRCAMLLF